MEVKGMLITNEEWEMICERREEIRKQKEYEETIGKRINALIKEIEDLKKEGVHFKIGNGARYIGRYEPLNSVFTPRENLVEFYFKY